MSQTAASPIRAALGFERTLVLIDVSNKSWVLAAQVPACRIQKRSVRLMQTPSYRAPAPFLWAVASSM